MKIILNKKHAFTLLEIIAVMVILGVLASLALTNVFSQINRQQGQEALNTLTLIRSSMEICGVQNAYNFSIACDAYAELDMADPSYNVPTGSNTGARFIYTIIATGNETYTLRATGRTAFANTITMVRNASGITCTGAGVFTGYC